MATRMNACMCALCFTVLKTNVRAPLYSAKGIDDVALNKK